MAKIKNPTMLSVEIAQSEELVELLRMNKNYVDEIFKRNGISLSSKEFIDTLEILCFDIMDDLNHLL